MTHTTGTAERREDGAWQVRCVDCDWTSGWHWRLSECLHPSLSAKARRQLLRGRVA